MAADRTDHIYLDHNATTPVFPEVVEAMRACWNEPYLNPSSQHEFGRRARRVLEDARDRIGELLGAERDRVIFTSGGTEANNLAIRGLWQRRDNTFPPRPKGTQLIVSSIEHPSVAGFADEIANAPIKFPLYSVSRTAVDTRGIVSAIDLVRCIGPKTRVAAIMLANNETGVI